MVAGSAGLREPGPPIPGPLDPVVLGPAFAGPPLLPCIPGGGRGALGALGEDPGEAVLGAEPGDPEDPELEPPADPELPPVPPPDPPPDPPPLWAIAVPAMRKPARAAVIARYRIELPRHVDVSVNVATLPRVRSAAPNGQADGTVWVEDPAFAGFHACAGQNGLGTFATGAG